MICRTWNTGLDEQKIKSYENFARSVSWPMFREQAGFKGCLMSRSNGQATVVTFWKTMNDARALEKSPSYLATVQNILETGFLRQPQSVTFSVVHLQDKLWPLEEIDVE